MLDTGIGEMQVNNLLAAINLPGIHHKSLKCRERESGSAFESVAAQSCAEGIELEKQATSM